MDLVFLFSQPFNNAFEAFDVRKDLRNRVENQFKTLVQRFKANQVTAQEFIICGRYKNALHSYDEKMANQSNKNQIQA